jgi:tetratricopeptide (TPR) repeat protein
METGKYLEADKVFDEIIADNPNKLDVLYNAAYCKLYIGRADIAVNYLQRFLIKNKNDAEVYNLLGLAYERTGYYENAIEQYSNAIRIEKKLYEAHFNRGRTYLALDNIELAKKDFDYAKKNKIINPELYFTTGELYSQLKQYDSALIDLNKIIKYKSDNPYYLAMLGDAYFVTAGNDTAKLEKAIEYYTKSIRLDSENVSILKNRAFVYDKLDMTEKGELDKNKILEIQQKKGINPDVIKYKRLSSEDKVFSIDIPEEWKILVSKNNDSDIIIFFDTNFNNSQKNGLYIYEFGGQIIYKPHYFEANLTDINTALEIRYNEFVNFVTKRKNFYNTTLQNYKEILKKSFSPNNNIIRNLLKYTFSAEDKKYFGIEYSCITTNGKLIDVLLWIPEEDSFFYEQLLDYIYESITVLEE